MEKYQDLIVTLIKNHRRYPGCESILDKIVEEVNDRAKDVINSVEDDSIITKYLTKIVSSAMITVPKEYNICPDVKRKARDVESSAFPPIEQATSVQNNQQENPTPEIDEVQLMESLENTVSQEDESDNTAIYDSIKNSLEFQDNENLVELNQDASLTEDLNEGFDNLSESDLETVNMEEELLPDTEELPAPTFEDTAEDEPLNIETAEDSETESLQENNIAVEDVNKDLVDKMINSSDSEYNDFQNISEKIDGLSAIYGEPDNEIEEIDSVFENDTDNVNPETKTETEPLSESVSEPESEPENEFNQEELTISDESETEQDILNITDNITDSEETEELEEFEPISLDETTEELEEIEPVLLDETSDELDEIAEELDESQPIPVEENLNVDNTADASFEDFGEETEESVELSEDNNIENSFNPPNISCFNFSANDTPIEYSEEIVKSLENYTNKNSELPIMDICKFKYCENKSISQIASELNLPKEDVLNVVEELIDTVEG